MAYKKKTTMSPILTAALGGAAGFGGARLAALGGRKLAENVEVVNRLPVNVGSAAAVLLGVGLAIFTKRPFLQGAGVGMVVTGGLDLMAARNDDDDDDDGDGDDDKALKRMAENSEEPEAMQDNAMTTETKTFDVRKVLEMSNALNN